MDPKTPHHIIADQLIGDARQAGNRDEMNRAFAAIEGRPAPDPEASLSPQPRPTRRKPKGSAS